MTSTLFFVFALLSLAATVVTVFRVRHPALLGLPIMMTGWLTGEYPLFHIAWQDLERDDLRVLTRTSLDESPSLAPNGTMLIYATQDQGRGILAVVSIDGRVKYRLPSSTGDVREPAWSPFIDTL